MNSSVVRRPRRRHREAAAPLAAPRREFHQIILRPRRLGLRALDVPGSRTEPQHEQERQDRKEGHKIHRAARGHADGGRDPRRRRGRDAVDVLLLRAAARLGRGLPDEARAQKTDARRDGRRDARGLAGTWFRKKLSSF